MYLTVLIIRKVSRTEAFCSFTYIKDRDVWVRVPPIIITINHHLSWVKLKACVCVCVTPTICFAFVLCSHRKFITLRILDREEYEKECSFYLVLEEPIWIRRRMKGVRVNPGTLQETGTIPCVCLPPLTTFLLNFHLMCHDLCQA